MSVHQLSDLEPSARNSGKKKTILSRLPLSLHQWIHLWHYQTGNTNKINKISFPLHPVSQKVKEMPPNFRIEDDTSNPPLQSGSLLPESNMWGKGTTKWAKPAHSLGQKEAATVSMVSGKDIFSMALEGAHIPWQQSLLLSSAVIKNHLSLSPYQALIKGSNDPQAEKRN